MTCRHAVQFRPCKVEDARDINDFLWSMKDDFRFSERRVVDDIVALLYDKGGIIGGYDGSHTVGLFGYFRGEPSKDYHNCDVGFVYIAGLDKAYRRLGAFVRGTHVLAKTLKSQGVRELRCHALETDPYTNRLYAKIGKPIGREANRRGDICILYSSSVEHVIASTMFRPPTPAIAAA